LTTPQRKKLIEVALPLDAIDAASAREKSIRHGHPSTLHLWWARRPLAACRAVLFGQLVDDPSSWPELWPTEAAQDAERQRLFRIIEAMVPWEASNDEVIFDAARLEIARSVARNRKADGEGTARDDEVLAEGVRPDVVNAYVSPIVNGAWSRGKRADSSSMPQGVEHTQALRSASHGATRAVMYRPTDPKRGAETRWRSRPAT
jgi:adenine-specific DNA methylase